MGTVGYTWSGRDSQGNVRTGSGSITTTTSTPTTGLPPLIGSSSKTTDWQVRKDMLEATGGRLEARRLFAGSLTDDMTPLLNECAQQTLTPVLSYKPGTWSAISNGSKDSSLANIAATLNTFGRPLFLTFAHEPQQQSAGDLVGESGSAAEFAAMTSYVADYFHARCPKVKVGPVMNGWIWSAQARGHSDSVLDVWLPASTRSKVDFIAGDHYASKNETEAAVTRCQRMVAWQKRVGYTGSAGVGETNGWIPTDLTNMFGYAKTEEQFRNGFVMLWNSTVSNAGPDDWRPVHETGLLDDFQNILRDWPR